MFYRYYFWKHCQFWTLCASCNLKSVEIEVSAMCLPVCFGSHETGMLFFCKGKCLKFDKRSNLGNFPLTPIQDMFAVCFINFVARKGNGAYRLQVSTIHTEKRRCFSDHTGNVETLTNLCKIQCNAKLLYNSPANMMRTIHHLTVKHGERK